MKIILTTFFLLFAMLANAQNVEIALNQYLATLPQSTLVSIRIEDLKGKVHFAKNELKKIPAASVIKVPIMVEVMEQVAAGKINLLALHTLKAADKTADGGALNAQAAGSKISILDLVRMMISVSDNTATNILINRIGAKAVNAKMKRLGLGGLQLNRKMLDTAAVAKGFENYVTPTEINTLFRQIYHKKIATPAQCDLMMGILKSCEDSTTFRKLLPKSLVMAHKTGELSYVRSDAGIVFANVPFVMSVFVEGTTTKEAEVIIGQIAELAYRYL